MSIRFAYLIEPPFNLHDTNGQLRGCDIELAQMVMSRIGESDVVFVETVFGDLLDGLAAGRWDITTGLFRTIERQRHTLFSRPIWALTDGLLVRKGNPMGISGYRSVATSDAVLGVIRAQVQHQAATDAGVPEDRIRVFDSYTDAAEAVGTKAVDAYASVARAHATYVETANGAGLACIDVSAQEREPGYGCFGFARGNHALKARIDRALTEILGSSEHRSMMLGHGFTMREIDLALSASPGTASC
jgi:polar amino acid transport system substrate-binding protein